MSGAAAIDVDKNPVVLLPYDPTWPAKFEQARAQIQEALGELVVAIEHSGSTAIPDLGGKDIIDMMVGVGSMDDAERCIEPLGRLGFVRETKFDDTIPDRRFFRRIVDGASTHHVHVIVHGGSFWVRNLLFRDYLRAHPDELERYKQLKDELAAKFPNDQIGYAVAKTSYCRGVEAKARAEAGLAGAAPPHAHEHEHGHDHGHGHDHAHSHDHGAAGSSLELDDPFDRCFFCAPEPWRVLFTGRHTHVVVGAGPLCPGYVMIAPRKHTHTAAEMEDAEFWEAQAVFEILKRALANQYGAGYSAYEHGRLGACVLKEKKGDLSSFCHHSHRVVVPRASHCISDILPWFDEMRTLETPGALQGLRGTPYVFYESHNPGEPLARVAFTGARGIPSQFMRRTLTAALQTGRDWNWREDFRYPEMVETLGRLRGEFLGLDPIDDLEIPTRERLAFNISIDGMVHVGKTEIARLLGRHFGRPVIETGRVFRHIASAQLHGTERPDAERLARAVLEDAHDPRLHTLEVTARATALSGDENIRREYEAILGEVLRRASPCILVGRDTWRLTKSSDRRLVLEASFETRLRRLLLRVAHSEHRLADVQALARQIRRSDELDRATLPSPAADGITWVQSDRQPLLAVFDAVLHALRG